MSTGHTEKLPDGFERDPNSGAILANDYAALRRHKKRRAMENRVDTMEKALGDIRNDISELKQLLHQCLPVAPK